MRFIFIWILIISPLHFSQTNEFEFHSTENIKKFADYLFCEKDFLRANLEYQKLENIIENDTIRFKIGLGFLNIGDYSNSIQKLTKITTVSTLFNDAKLLQLKAYFLSDNYNAFRSFYLNNFPIKNSDYQTDRNRLFNFS